MPAALAAAPHSPPPLLPLAFPLAQQLRQRPYQCSRHPSSSFFRPSPQLALAPPTLQPQRSSWPYRGRYRPSWWLWQHPPQRMLPFSPKSWRCRGSRMRSWQQWQGGQGGLGMPVPVQQQQQQQQQPRRLLPCQQPVAFPLAAACQCQWWGWGPVVGAQWGSMACPSLAQQWQRPRHPRQRSMTPSRS